MFWPFTIWLNCSSDLNFFENSQPSSLNFKSFFSITRTTFSHNTSEQFWKQKTIDLKCWGGIFCFIDYWLIIDYAFIKWIIVYHLSFLKWSYVLTQLGCQSEWPKDKPFLLMQSRHARNSYDPKRRRIVFLRYFHLSILESHGWAG